jgi:dienelactone hydrolase
MVDPNRIALMGICIGGYLAARAAAFEDRIAACVLYKGVYDGYDAFALGFPQSLRIAVENGNANVVNTVIDILSDIDANMRFNTACGLLELIHHLN